eukprot:4020303-Prymnesium_polylepis.1
MTRKGPRRGMAARGTGCVRVLRARRCLRNDIPQRKAGAEQTRDGLVITARRALCVQQVPLDRRHRVGTAADVEAATEAESVADNVPEGVLVGREGLGLGEGAVRGL